MSTIRVDNFGPSSGGTTYSARGIAKAWVNFNGIGTIAARDSENVSSLTDNATGRYIVNFSSSMSDTNFCGVTTSGYDANAFTVTSEVGNVGYTRTTGSLVIQNENTSGTILDALQVNASIHGDLA